MSDFLSADFLKFFLPFAGGVIAWFVNESRRRSWEEYQRKEERYRELLRTLRGFYISAQDRVLKQAFLEQVNLCWLYCPDEVLQRAYAFLSTVHTGATHSDPEKEKAAGELIAAIRRDLLSRKVVKRTQLGASDFKHLIAT